jgi:hypothetical protein
MRLDRLAFVLALCAAIVAFVGTPIHAQQAQPSPSPAPSAVETQEPLPSPVPTAEDPKIHKLAVQQFLAFQQGQLDRTLYEDQVNGELTDDVVDRASKALANMGALQAAVFRGISHTKQGDLYVYHMACDRGSVDMAFSLDPKGLIQVIFFQ